MAANMPKPGDNPELDAETRVPTLIAISVVFASLSVAIVTLRLYTRRYVVSALGTDDATIVIATILSIAVSILTILQAAYGLGLHTWMTDKVTTAAQLRSLLATEIIYNFAQYVTKISFLLQYRRIFKDGHTRDVCLFLMVFLIVWAATQEFLVGFACKPVSDLSPDHESHCIETLAVWYLTSVMNIVTDFAVFLTPIPAIRGLQLRRKQKISVGAIFCLGFFTCIISIVRLFTLRAAINTPDPAWDNVPTSYWSVVELNCGILCASAATLRPLLRKYLPGLRSRYSQTYTNGKTAGTDASTTHVAPPDLYALPSPSSDVNTGLTGLTGSSEAPVVAQVADIDMQRPALAALQPADRGGPPAGDGASSMTWQGPTAFLSSDSEGMGLPVQGYTPSPWYKPTPSSPLALRPQRESGALSVDISAGPGAAAGVPPPHSAARYQGEAAVRRSRSWSRHGSVSDLEAGGAGQIHVTRDLVVRESRSRGGENGRLGDER